jgi:hypothetical protein
VRHTVTLFPHWCNGGVGQVCKAEGATQPSPKQLSVEDGLKLQIVNQLRMLGIDAVDKAGYEAAVIERTQLQLVPENYQEINARLAVLIQERKAI